MSDKTYDIKMKHCTMKDARVEVMGTYDDGSIAVQLVDFEGPERVSTCLSSYNHIPTPGHNQFYVKNYSEHEGLAFALRDAGVVTVLKPVVFGPFDSAAYLVQLVTE